MWLCMQTADAGRDGWRRTGGRPGPIQSGRGRVAGSGADSGDRGRGVGVRPSFCSEALRRRRPSGVLPEALRLSASAGRPAPKASCSDALSGRLRPSFCSEALRRRRPVRMPCPEAGSGRTASARSWRLYWLRWFPDRTLAPSPDEGSSSMPRRRSGFWTDAGQAGFGFLSAPAEQAKAGSPLEWCSSPGRPSGRRGLPFRCPRVRDRLL